MYILYFSLMMAGNIAIVAGHKGEHLLLCCFEPIVARSSQCADKMHEKLTLIVAAAVTVALSFSALFW